VSGFDLQLQEALTVERGIKISCHVGFVPTILVPACPTVVGVSRDVVLSLIKFTKFMTSVWETLYPVDGELV
jgi:hypothetical protein